MYKEPFLQGNWKIEIQVSFKQGVEPFQITVRVQV